MFGNVFNVYVLAVSCGASKEEERARVRSTSGHLDVRTFRKPHRRQLIASVDAEDAVSCEQMPMLDERDVSLLFREALLQRQQHHQLVGSTAAGLGAFNF